MSIVGIDPALVMTSLGNTAVVGTIAKFGVSFPLIYHYLGGNLMSKYFVEYSIVISYFFLILICRCKTFTVG